MIKVSGLNVMYKTFDFIIPLGVRIFKYFGANVFLNYNKYNLKKITKQNKIQLFQKQLSNKVLEFCF